MEHNQKTSSLPTLEEFRQWFDTIRNKPDQWMRFITDLKNSPYIEYHYTLLTDDSLPASLLNDLANFFIMRTDGAEEWLLSQLESHTISPMWQPSLLLLLGKSCSRRNDKDTNYCKTLEYARDQLHSEDEYMREKAIIVIGWMGEDQDIPSLEKHLLSDPFFKCRAWSATAFRFLRITNKAEKGLPTLRKALEQESHSYVLGNILEVTQELVKKKWISNSHVQSDNKEQIEAARAKAIRYFQKIDKAQS